LAEAQGVPARQVDTVDALDESIRWSLETRGPTLLDIRIA
jgi:thiamine pyrophosphate-dependent acetolactate synthase large subunit-like protein